MYTQTIYELSQEAERLLQLALRHLQSLKTLPVSNQNAQDAPRPVHFSPEGINTQQATLNNELRKITRLEMVLAIVGTMKAGKSTTINAIVGTEVLPNRNRPMTAIPTLIRHTPGQKEPGLHFTHPEPIDRLMQELQNKISHIDRNALAEKLELDKDMNTLLDHISHGVAFEKHYLGAQPIFHCLKSLNDLVRLSQALEAEFPFAEYAAIEHIPVIEVEFVHLSAMGSFPGQLTLLDTPGPNEAGQPHLQKMLSEQLSRASAVLAVMDYTQLKSVSDEEMRQAIAAVGRSVPLYALVNKFDQKDRNSDDEDQVRALISGTLMKGCITPGQIFPVSSMWGYLANRARHELNVYGRLPSPEEQRWVQDFAEAALGRRWRSEDLQEAGKMHHAAQLLWEDSLFEQPIRKLLHAAHTHASLFALRSASHKLLNYATQARDYLDFRHQGMTVAFDQLQHNIVGLEESMAQFEARKHGVTEEVHHEVIEALSAVEGFIAEQQANALQNVTRWFAEENLRRLSGDIPVELRTMEDGEPGPVVLNAESEAHCLLSKIRQGCESMLLTTQQTLTRELSQRFAQLEISLTRTLEEALRPIELHIKEELGKAGFRARISLPPFRAGLVDFNIPLVFADAIAREDTPVSALPRVGVRESVSRWLNNPGWGWDDYVMTQSRYVIDIPALKQKLIFHISQFCEQILKALGAQVDVAVTAGMTTFFAGFSQNLAGLQKNLQESLNLRQQHQSAVMTLNLQLQQSLSTVRWIQEDARLLRDDIQTLFVVEQT
ncbi:clamp-binding protein CrfC [Trabulsiella odontotermitis]|uniref:clamp-binding protein CrfC n=1 Tax=Trabulsiella odontotermitis TaxID=379893 RepID=UPI0024B720B2|nr:clamp-binding protein CrfC [Trabulsiella odontotermitis]WHP31048.1 clamp-binding protein CrfC [Trabulsiella odontotermitis]